MINIKYVIHTILLLFLLIPSSVLAKGDITLSSSDITIIKGEEEEITIKANNLAGRIDITSSNTSVATVSEKSLFLDMDEQTITINALAVGTSIIEVYSTDITTYDDEDLTGKTYTINVEVVANDNEENKNLSNNNKLKDIYVEDFELEKVDDNNYSLTVGNDVLNIYIKATAIDSKATVTGTGKQELKVGKNNIEVIVTSESGVQNKINLVVTRNVANKIEEMDMLLNKDTKEEINIIIEDDTVLTESHLTKIKNSKKLVKFNYYDNNNKLIYSWQVDGTKLKSTKELLTTISYMSDYTSDIEELSNNKDGLYISFKNNNVNLEGFKVKLYVADKFNNDDVLEMFSYDKDKKILNLISDNILVEGDYIIFDVKDKEIFLTKIDNNSLEKNNTLLIITISVVVLIGLILVLIKRFGISKNK